MADNNIVFRYQANPEDIEKIKEITESTNFFYDYEVEVAVELIQERLSKGETSGYNFIFADIEGKTIAYSCYGHIACTKDSYDLYWIVTHNDYRGKGLGRLLLRETEYKIKKSGGKKIYAETSSLPKYEPTRRFYLSNEYISESVLKDFYNDNDDKIVYVKRF